MGIVLWIAVGFALGAIAKMAMPGPDPLGPTGRALVGIVGALIGGVIGTVLSGESLAGNHLHSFLAATGGALFALFSYRCIAIRGMD
jgi:uncharacterized membrane protein YeaQ/YmgE (transglycosylase-associated protein family)